MKRYVHTISAVLMMSFCLSGCGGINIYVNSDGNGGVKTEFADTSEETSENTDEGSTENTSSETESTEESSEEVFKKLESEKDGVKVSIEKLEEWEGESEKFAKYDVTIENSGENDLKDWSMECKVGDSFEIVQMWGGKYEIEDGELKITPEEYTKEIKTSGKVNFGFNSKDTGKKPNIKEFEFESGDITLEG
ncbi:MAG: cellulose binding domain-containing protein [Firmicutes bacterium]|nr:cellulose binding domain-containing protein [Bacillota bacterium]